jgi:hypothetical protein
MLMKLTTGMRNIPIVDQMRPTNPEITYFGLLFDENTLKMGKNTTNVAIPVKSAKSP